MEVRKLEIVKVTRTMAQKMLEEFPYQRQRDVNGRQVTYYAEQMAANQWQPYSNLEIAYLTNGDGKEHGYLVNGQHRLYAIIESNKPQEFVIQHIVCQSHEEVGRRYGTVDVGKVRTPGDFARALDLSHELGFKEYHINRLTSAVTAIHNDFKRAGRFNLTTVQKFDLIRQYRAEARQYFAMTAGGVFTITKQMMRAFPLALAMVTLREAVPLYGEDKVRAFWSGIAFDNGLKVGDPRKVANRHFEEVSNTARAHEALVQPNYTVRYIANCWNAFVEDRELKTTRVIDPNGPIEIKGTRFKGKE